MKIDSKKVLKDFSGKELKLEGGTLTVGKALSYILNNHKAEGKMKLYTLSQQFYEERPLELDKADFALIKGAVEANDSFPTAIVTGQLLLILSEVKED